MERWLETPLILLGLLWLVLLVIELRWGLSPFLETIGTLIWLVFIIDFRSAQSTGRDLRRVGFCAFYCRCMVSEYLVMLRLH